MYNRIIDFCIMAVAGVRWPIVVLSMNQTNGRCSLYSHSNTQSTRQPPTAKCASDTPSDSHPLEHPCKLACVFRLDR